MMKDVRYRLAYIKEAWKSPIEYKRLAQAKLKVFRNKNYLSQKDASFNLGWSRSKLADFERGRFYISYKDINTIAAYMEDLKYPETLIKEFVDNAALAYTLYSIHKIMDNLKELYHE